MLRQLKDRGERAEEGAGSLRALTAHLLLLTGADAAFGAYARGKPRSYAAIWGPALIAPLAATAHLAHLARPSDSTTRATRFLDVAVIGLGVAAAVGDLVSRRSARTPPLAPLALASAGLLGAALDREESATRAELRRLRRRASVVERLVPRRRSKLDRVVVHV